VWRFTNSQAERLEGLPAMLTPMRLKEKKKTQPDFETHILAMFLLYASRPRKAEPDESGSYFIGDVGNARLNDQRLSRETPYSICKGIRK